MESGECKEFEGCRFKGYGFEGCRFEGFGSLKIMLANIEKSEVKAKIHSSLSHNGILSSEI